MQIYIDESGNLGRKGRFFVIAALIPEKPKRIKNIVKRCCVGFGPGTSVLDELKGSCLTLPQRQNFLARMSKKDDFVCSYIVADKKHIEPRILEDKNLCFNYLIAHLLRPIIRGTDGEDVHIIIDNRSLKVTSVNSLQDYIRIQAYTSWGFRNALNFEYCDSKQVKNLQAVDIVSNTIYRRYSYNKNHPYNLLTGKYQHTIKFPYKKFGN